MNLLLGLIEDLKTTNKITAAIIARSKKIISNIWPREPRNVTEEERGKIRKLFCVYSSDDFDTIWFAKINK